MDHERFRDWFSHVDDLRRRKEVSAALSGRPQGAASLATIEAWTKSGAVRTAAAVLLSGQGARFAAIGARPAGFGALTGMSGLHHKIFGRSGDDSAASCGKRRIVAPPLPGGGSASAGLPGSSRPTLFVLESRKREIRKPRRRLARPANAASRASRCRILILPIAQVRPSATPCLPSTPTA